MGATLENLSLLFLGFCCYFAFFTSTVLLSQESSEFCAQHSKMKKEKYTYSKETHAKET